MAIDSGGHRCVHPTYRDDHRSRNHRRLTCVSTLSIYFIVPKLLILLSIIIITHRHNFVYGENFLTSSSLPLSSTVFSSQSSSPADIFDHDQSIAYKLLPSSQKKHIQVHLLDFFGLDHVPNPQRKDSSKYLKHIHSRLDENTASLTDTGGENEFIIDGEILSSSTIKAINDSDVIISFSNQCDDYSDSISTKNEYKHLWFKTKEIGSISENLLRAELRLYRNISSSSYWNHTSSGSSFEVKIYLVSRNKDQIDYIKLIDSNIIQKNQSGWIVFNVTASMEQWILYPDENDGLLVSFVETTSGKLIGAKDFGMLDSHLTKDRNPFLVAYFHNCQDRVHRRRRQKRDYTLPERNPFHEYGPRSRRSCQRRSLFVAFKELGWQKWIIAPDGYQAFYCDGQCSFPLNAHMNATNHAIIQTLVHLMDPSQVQEPLCAPTQLSSIMVLYFDDTSNVILKKYKNMVVQACGCS
ncbi:bone morphogenetic protein 7-like [Brevipalpus obovatus]|uniref:bone morphogenetic protein 7-like n=1 Tax=Brevipalpus obovatus TaxID=246614 RepID=UPI003D9F286A